MAEINFFVPGEPFSKQRHRTTKEGHNYTPEQTVSHENFIKMLYLEQGEGSYLNGPMGIDIKAYFKMPASGSKLSLWQRLKGLIRPTKKPDLDNMMKIVCDSLNCVAYDDDKFFVKSSVQKWFSARPRLVIRMWEMTEEELLEGGELE